MPQIEISTGATLDVLEAGDSAAPPVILIHGLLGTGALHFSQLIAWLAPDHHVIAPSLRGYGESTPKPRDFPADFYWRDADDIIALMDALGLERVRLMGYSDGGETALCACARAPERFESAVVWGAVGHFGAAIRPIAQSLYPATWITPELQATHGIAHPDAFILRWIKAFHQIIDSGGNVSYEQAPTIQAPVLMLLGERDTMNPASYGQSYIERVPDGRLVVLPCGHAVHDEAWSAFTSAVQAFWAGEDSV